MNGSTAGARASAGRSREGSRWASKACFMRMRIRPVVEEMAAGHQSIA